MKSTSQVFKGGITVGTGQVLSQAFSFVRNIIIARLISPADFGIAAMFAMTFSLLDMISNLSADKLLIQAEDGDVPSFQKTAQLIHFGRGLMNAAIILALAFPVSHLFGVPQARWAFECLALAPLLRGFIHLDTFRFQREMRFRPAVTADVGSQILVTAAALPLAWWLRDYTAMLWVLILQAGSAAILSHAVAERPYGWAWDGARAGRIMAFGWPLLVNGVLLFIIMEGDRFMIGSAHRLFSHSPLSLADLGVYSVAFALTMAPTMFVANVGTSVLLPHLSRVQKLSGEFEQRYALFAQVISLAAAMIATPFIVAGGWLVVLVYGSKYAAAVGFIGWLAAMWALRMVRVTPTLAAMAFGDTQNAMISNIARTVALAGVVAAAALGGSVAWIAFSGFVGEMLALGVCVGRLRRVHGISAGLSMKPFAVCAAVMAAGGVAAYTGVERLGAILSFGVATLVVVGGVFLMMVSFPMLRHKLAGLAFGFGLALRNEKAVS